MKDPAASSDVLELLLTLLGSVLPPRSAIYAAGPLDTGRSYYEALAWGGFDAISIRLSNETALAAFVNRLRGDHHPTPVVDPGPLRVAGWTASQVGYFFLETISRFAKEAWFIDGWEYSSGATKEYLHCVSLGIPCFSESGEELLPPKATNLLCSAVEAIEHLGVPATKLKGRLAAFLSLNQPVGS